eukprot:TRINITY_DN15885_c0_g1_i10.p1 TRINITY_DN15885_c0_g1~~TRINITY_DN15885_c0_g1_i10.p1  ORF type:complete len:622 (+),score=163.07 TRINITY_DN15885_c0_g1_i10:77-1867(+)
MGPRGGRGPVQRRAASLDEVGGVSTLHADGIDWHSREALVCTAKWRRSKCTMRLVPYPPHSHRGAAALELAEAEGRWAVGTEHADGILALAAEQQALFRRAQGRLAAHVQDAAVRATRAAAGIELAEAAGRGAATAERADFVLALTAEKAGLLRDAQGRLAARVQDAAVRGARAAAAVELAEAEGRVAVEQEHTEFHVALATESKEMLRRALGRAAAAEAEAAEQRPAAQAEVQNTQLRLQRIGAEHAAALRRADALQDSLHDAAAARHAAQMRHAESERRAESAQRAAAMLQRWLDGLGKQHAEALWALDVLRTSVHSQGLTAAGLGGTGQRAAGADLGGRSRDGPGGPLVLPSHQPALGRVAAVAPGEDDAVSQSTTISLLPLAERPCGLTLVAGSGIGRQGRRSAASTLRPLWGARTLTPRTHTEYEVLRIDSVAHRIAQYCPGYWAQACSAFAEASYTMTRMCANGLSEMSRFAMSMQTPKSFDGRYDISPAVIAARAFRELRQEVMHSVRGMHVDRTAPLVALMRRIDMVVMIFEECRVHLADLIYDIAPVQVAFWGFSSGVAAVLEARDRRLAPPAAPSAPATEPRVCFI